MIRRVKIAAFVIASMIGISIAGLHAQEQIRPADSTQLLRRIWMIRGSVVPGNEQIGRSVASLGDISGDGIGDFAVLWGGDGLWRIYYGRDSAPSTTPAWIADTVGSVYLPVGDFWGTGHTAIGLAYYNEDPFNGARYIRVKFYRTEHDSIDPSPALTFAPAIPFGERDMIGRDVDGDGRDEFILSRISSNRVAEIWIFRGGGDFQVDTPAVILHDPENVDPNSSYSMVVGDFDGDHKPDILTGGTYATGQQLKFWFSSRHASVWEWDQPDRTVTLNESSYPSIYNGFAAGDLDGDRIMDLAFPIRDGTTRLYLSGAVGKEFPGRSFMLDDADRTFDPGFTQPRFAGYLNDQNYQYGMVGMVGNDSAGHGIFATLGCGPFGPDGRYEAYFDPSTAGFYPNVSFANCLPLKDVSGDGWDDLLVGDWHYYDEILHPGIAFVLAGGPYIPRDISLGVREVVAENRHDALSIWPVPVLDELHIAWRGDLARMPEHFVVHNLLGRIVAEGSAESWQGAVVWKCASDPSGVYLLTILDRDGVPIATVRVLKE